MIELMIDGIIAGISGTIVMDLLNRLFSRLGILSKVEFRMIGRMAAGWTRGRFFYRHPGEMRQIPNETLYGFITHYGIGVVLASVYIFGWNILSDTPVSAAWAIVYGEITTVASYFIVYPFMGYGVCGRRSPEGRISRLSPLANHLFFGIGMAVAIALL